MYKKITALTAGAVSTLFSVPAIAQVAGDFTNMTAAVTTNAQSSTGFIVGIAGAMIGLAFIGGILRTAMGFGKMKK